MPSVGVVCPQQGCHIPSGRLNWALVSVAWPLCVWHVRNWCGMASVDVTWPQEMWVDVTWPQWVWHSLNGCGMV